MSDTPTTETDTSDVSTTGDSHTSATSTDSEAISEADVPDGDEASQEPFETPAGAVSRLRGVRASIDAWLARFRRGLARPTTTETRQDSPAPTILADGGQDNAKVIGHNTDGSGQTVGVWGEVDSSDGCGLATPDDARIDGVIDTNETDFTVEAGTSSTGAATNVVLGHAANDVLDGAVGTTIAGGGIYDGSLLFSNNLAYDNYGTIGGGINNQAGSNDSDPSTASYATVGGGSGNTASGPYSTVGGGQYNDATASHATVAGGGSTDNSDSQGNVVYDDYGTVGGGGNNQAGSDDEDDTNAWFATVGGGGNNTASKDSATVGGGSQNTASGISATVAGGTDNTASGEGATVGGGGQNTASALSATVGGGTDNTASGEGATVGGGGQNTASGFGSTVPGGVGGAAESDRAFVWNANGAYHAIPNVNIAGLSSDKSVDGEPVTGSNTFSVSARGGVRFITGGSSVTYIDGGSVGWTNTSSRAAKTNIDTVDPQQVLDGVDDLDIAAWEYKDGDGEGAGTTHIGPMAGEFHDIVDVGSSEEHINTINADGVLFAAVQGLSAKLDANADQIDQLESRVDAKDERIDRLEAESERKESRIETLEAENETIRARLAAVEDHLDIERTADPADPPHT
jgi:chaperonin cofactor prefoldin